MDLQDIDLTKFKLNPIEINGFPCFNVRYDGSRLVVNIPRTKVYSTNIDKFNRDYMVIVCPPDLTKFLLAFDDFLKANDAYPHYDRTDTCETLLIRFPTRKVKEKVHLLYKINDKKQLPDPNTSYIQGTFAFDRIGTWNALNVTCEVDDLIFRDDSD